MHFQTILKQNFWRKNKYIFATGEIHENFRHESVLFLWVVTTYGHVGRYKPFRETYCLHPHISTYESTQSHSIKTIFTARRTSNFTFITRFSSSSKLLKKKYVQSHYDQEQTLLIDH
jgi:hypothetical protein